ncbi:hypothetical protein ACFX1T_003016 [Malus domestica]
MNINNIGYHEEHRFLAMLSPRNNHTRRNFASHDVVETAHFLRTCGLCKCQLASGRDIYMYRNLRELDWTRSRDLVVPGGPVVPDVSTSIRTAVGKDVVCIRSFQLTQKTWKMEFKAIDSRRRRKRVSAKEEGGRKVEGSGPKTYNDIREEEKRFEIFKDNLKFIEEHNALDRPYKVGLNAFADLTNQEYRANFLGTRSDPKRRVMKAKNPSLRYAFRTGETLPESVDWRVKGAVNPIKNQGSYGVVSMTFTMQNKCDYTVWLGSLSNVGVSPLPTTAFTSSIDAASQNAHHSAWKTQN